MPANPHIADSKAATPAAVVLISGGLDSCVTAAIAAVNHRVAFLHLSYGQLTESREMRAFTAIADHFGVEERLVCQLPHLRQIGGSSLIAGVQDSASQGRASTVPPSARVSAINSSAEDGGNLPDTYVPFRNANLLAVAVAWAETLGATSVFIGAHQADSPYPDCSAEFFAAYGEAVATGTAANSNLSIRTPLLLLDKAAIVRRGVEVGAPLHLTWSCYTSSEAACGICHSCQLRRRGFADAGIPDPIPYS